MSAVSAIFYVYILFRLNGLPCYVGKGRGNRWVRHGGRSKHLNRHLGSIIDQAKAAGRELPRVKVAEGLTEEAAFELGRGENGPLVNLTDGGDGVSGYKFSPELVERLTAKRRGKLHPPGSNAKRSAALKGRPKSAAHKTAAAAGQLGSKKSFGWWSTEEGRAKIGNQIARKHFDTGMVPEPRGDD